MVVNKNAAKQRPLQSKKYVNLFKRSWGGGEKKNGKQLVRCSTCAAQELPFSSVILHQLSHVITQTKNWLQIFQLSKNASWNFIFKKEIGAEEDSSSGLLDASCVSQCNYWIMFCLGYHSHGSSIGYMTRSFGFIFSYTENDVTTIHPCICYGKTT